MHILAAVMVIAYVAQWFVHGDTQVGLWWVALLCAFFGLRAALTNKFLNEEREKSDE